MSRYCSLCNKKMKSLLPIPCKCNKIFCNLHKIDHNCKYDYIKEQQEKIKRNNPIIIAPKI